MPYPADLDVRDRGLSRLAQEMLPVLYQHRLVATSQLHTLLQPHTADPAYLRRQLARLRSFGLAGSTVRRQAGQGELLSYTTPLGCEVVEAGGEVTPRVYRMSPQAAASQLQEHTLAVTATGAAFVAAARRLGHECGPLSWEPEVAHRMRDGEDRLRERAFLIPDAVLRYIHVAERQRTLLTYFLELDRGTESAATLVAKLSAYARYHSYMPSPAGGRGQRQVSTREAWRDRYATFPRVLIVLAGKSEAAMARRAADLRALAAADARLRRAADHITAGILTLEQLRAQGPFAPIVTPLLGEPAATDVFLQPDGLRGTS